MSKDLILNELETLLKNLSIEVKYSKGYFQGGLCRYRDKKIIYLNKSHDIDSHISLILSELKEINLEGINFSSNIKNLLHNSVIN